MSDESNTDPADLQRIVESAQRLGVEMDEAEALQWLAAVAVAHSAADIAIDTSAGVYGHRVTMLDFSDEELAYFRRVGEIVGLAEEPGVETALALSGSAAQSKIQTYPGDCDYFERINIKAPTREAACARLADVLRRKALTTLEGETYRLIEVKFGSYPQDVLRAERHEHAGSAIVWLPDDVVQGSFGVQTLDGDALEISWAACAQDPGWCKIDWVVADPIRRQVANASNMLDVTWEAPDGSIEPLDGYLDPYFQEVYLEAGSIPLFSKLVRHVSADALQNYVDELETEVRKHVTGDPRNYGKAAKRMYNIFRYSGRYEEAAFVRELFDEPTAALYQTHHLLRTLEEASQPGSSITKETVLDQLDQAIITVVDAAEGEEEVEIVRSLLQLRKSIADEPEEFVHSDAVEAARERLLNLVNNFFHEKLTGMPSIASYLDDVSTN